MKKLITALDSGRSLTETEMEKAMDLIMEGKAFPDDLLNFLEKLSARMPSVDEITGAAKVLRTKALKIKCPYGTIDCCGTGGDGGATYNISTAVAFVAAACGVPVAKHGNRAVTSRTGAADVLEVLGANLDMSFPALEESLKTLNFAFLLAPRHHPAMKHVAIARKKIGRRTLFNLLGPLANPAGAKLQLLGVYDPNLVRPMTEVLNRLGTRRAWVVHGSDGMDEITLSGPTRIAMLAEEAITETTLTPEDFGLKSYPADQLRGDDAAHNATALRAVLEGQIGAHRDTVLANAAAVLCIQGRAENLKDGVMKAAAAIDSGGARGVLKDYVAFSRQAGTGA